MPFGWLSLLSPTGLQKKIVGLCTSLASQESEAQADHMTQQID